MFEHLDHDPDHPWPEAPDAISAVGFAFVIGVLGAVAVVALVVVLFLMRPAMAEAPPGTDPNSPTAKWFKSLTVPEGGPGAGEVCCDPGETRFLEAEVKADGTWRVLLNGEWRDIPPNKVLKEVSPSERGIVFLWPVGTDQIRCFVPPLRGS